MLFEKAIVRLRSAGALFVCLTTAAATSSLYSSSINDSNIHNLPTLVDILQKSGYLFEPETKHYLQTYKAPLFHAITPYYVEQRNDVSCSLATATILLNTILGIRAHQRLDTPLTQDEVLEKVNNPLWASQTALDGQGVDTVEQYGQFLTQMFLAYKIENVSVDSINVVDKSEKTQQLIHNDLLDLANENEVTTLLALVFDERYFINCPEELGHISPVGGYDPLTRHVLVLDTERRWTGPYWITEETMINGVSLPSESPYGYIRIRLIP